MSRTQRLARASIVAMAVSFYEHFSPVVATERAIVPGPHYTAIVGYVPSPAKASVCRPLWSSGPQAGPSRNHRRDPGDESRAPGVGPRSPRRNSGVLRIVAGTVGKSGRHPRAARGTSAAFLNRRGLDFSLRIHKSRGGPKIHSSTIEGYSLWIPTGAGSPSSIA